MRRIHVAVIDDGVNEARYGINNLRYNVEITLELNILENPCQFGVYEPTSHGTICAGIIRQYAPDVDISSIRMLNYQRLGSTAQLAKALEWCLGHDVDVVNVSLGSTIHKDYYILNDILEELLERNIVVVAACSNRNKYTYPASMSQVVGVKNLFLGLYNSTLGDIPSLGKIDYMYRINAADGIDIVLSGWIHLEDDGILDGCNSYATAYVSAMISNMKKQGISTIEGVHNALAINATDENILSSYKILPVPPAIRVVGSMESIVESVILMLQAGFESEGYNCLSGGDASFIGWDAIKSFGIDLDSIPQVFEYDILLYGSMHEKMKWMGTDIFDIDILLINNETIHMADDEIKECEYQFLLCMDKENYYKLINANRKFVFLYEETDLMYKTIMDLYGQEEKYEDE